MKIRQPGDLLPYVPWRPPEGFDTSLGNVANYVRLLDHVGQIVEAMEVTEPPANAGHEEETFVPHLGTYLKLLLVASYARTIFLDIGSRHTSKLYYLDILSASGLSYPRNSGRPVPGSCFFVPMARQDFSTPRSPPEIMFSKMWAFDSSGPLLEVLKRRHAFLASRAGLRVPPIEAVPGDANHTIPAIVKSLADERVIDFRRQRPPSLIMAFIDNIGLDVEMKTVGAIQSSIRADLIIHLNVRGIWRNIEKYRQHGEEPRKLDAFFGSREAWVGINGPDEIPEAYQQGVQQLTIQGLQRFDPVYIRSAREEFALCIYTRKTEGIQDGAVGWVDKIGKLGAACNQVTPELLERVLSVTTKNQAVLDNFEDEPGN